MTIIYIEVPYNTTFISNTTECPLSKLLEPVKLPTSSGAQHNILYCTELCNAVFCFVLLMMNDWIRSKHVEQAKNFWIKIDYKNCASRWSLTYCNMMHGTHNVKTGIRLLHNFGISIKLKDVTSHWLLRLQSLLWEVQILPNNVFWKSFFFWSYFWRLIFTCISF